MMKIKKEFIVAVMAVLCLIATLFVTVPTRSQTGTEYDPWMDVNDDGSIDMADISIEIDKFMTTGTPGTKASVQYDSDWINITDKQGQSFNVLHNLNSTDIMVDITGKTTADGSIHQTLLGGEDYIPEEKWQKSYLLSGSHYANSIVHTKDGGYAIAGNTSEGSSPDFWLTKIDSNGAMQWNKHYGGEYEDSAYSGVQTVDRGFALVGYTTLRLPLPVKTGWLVKTDASGNMEWNRTFSAASVDRILYSVVQANDGGYVMCGINGTGENRHNVSLAKTDSAGAIQWQKHYGSGYRFGAYSLVQNYYGGFAIAGYGETQTAPLSFLLLVTDSNGTMLWNKTYTSTDLGETIAQSIIQTNDGGYALAGFTDHQRFWLVKTDVNGVALWNHTYSDMVRARSVVQAADGGYVLAGGSQTHLVLIKTDVNGTSQWTRDYSLDARSCSLVQTGDLGYAAGGTSGSGQGIWLIKTDRFGRTYGEAMLYGLARVATNTMSITLYRGAYDPYWNYVRVRIWQVKESP